MNFINKTKGAVSVFLVIILVPMLTMSALFVDASKVKLAKSVAISAGDLALNTALTDYDTKLKDLYGIFATAQDTDELFAKLEDYYKSSMMSVGVDSNAAQSYTDEIMAQLGLLKSDTSASDLLGIRLVEGTFSVAKMQNANLANSVMLQKQIVNFMKYRSPIQTGLSFMSALKSFSSLAEQTDLVDKRQEYYTAEKDVMTNLKKAWENINAYNNNVCSKESFYQSLQKDVNSYEGLYRDEIHNKTVMDLYEAQDAAIYTWKRVENLQKTVQQADGSVDVKVLGLVDYNTYEKYGQTNKRFYEGHPPTVKDIQEDIKSFYKWAEKYTAAVNAIKGNVNNANSYYDIQFLVQNNRGKLEELDNAAKNINYYYQRLKNERIWIADYVDADNVTVTAETVLNTNVSANGQTQTIENWIGMPGETKTIDQSCSNYLWQYNTYSKTFGEISTAVLNSGRTSTDGVNATASSISNRVSGAKNNLNDASAHLDAAIKYLNAAKTSVSSGELSTAKANWNSAADRMNHTSMGKQDKAELLEIGKYLNPEEMGKLIQRLENMKAHISENMTQLDGYKYFSYSIANIGSYETVHNLLRDNVGDGTLKDVNIDLATLKNQSNNMFRWENGNLNIAWNNAPGTEVSLTKNKLNFYTYLYTHFGGSEDTEGNTTNSTAEKKEDGEQYYENIKKNSGSKAKNDTESNAGNKLKGEDIFGKKQLPSEGKAKSTGGISEVNTGDNAAKGTSGGLSGFMGGALNEILKLGTDARDNMYMADYILGMFSYDTIETEYKKKMGADAKLDLKSLTLQPINQNNNLAYGSEVEYILYGKTNKENVSTAYTTIYGIRLAFNMIYGFMTAEIRDTAFAMATPISAATLGVIPVPLIQAAIVIGLSCMESGFDIEDLKNGNAIPLFKTSNTWRASPTGLMKYAKDTAKDMVKDTSKAVIDATSQKLSEYLDMTDAELSENLEAKQDEIAAHLTTAFDNTVGNAANAAIQKLTTAANDAIEQFYAGTLHSTEEMEAYVAEKLDAWANAEDSSSLASTAKKEAVKIIKEQYMGSVIDALKKSKDVAQGNVNEASESLNKILSRMRVDITDIVTNQCENIRIYRKKMLNEVKASMQEGAESLKNTLNKHIDGIFGETGSDPSKAPDQTATATLFSFHYSDYLRLFLLIGLFTNPDAVTKRTADVIQVNMIKQGDKDFRMENAAVYVEIQATIQVKPTLLALPLFADVEKNPKDKTGWYTIPYKAVRGY